MTSCSFINIKWMLAHSKDVCTNTCAPWPAGMYGEHRGESPAVINVKRLISGLNLWCQSDESILKEARKNTKVVVQGQIYTEGYLSISVTSGLTYSSDACTGNTQGYRHWFETGEWCWEGVSCSTVSIQRFIHLTDTAVFLHKLRFNKYLR